MAESAAIEGDLLLIVATKRLFRYLWTDIRLGRRRAPLLHLIGRLVLPQVQHGIPILKEGRASVRIRVELVILEDTGRVLLSGARPSPHTVMLILCSNLNSWMHILLLFIITETFMIVLGFC